MILNGIFYVILSTLEKRFLLTSGESGSINSVYNISYLIFGLFVTFYANRAHRPKMLSVGSAILGLGCLIFALPHYTTPLYDYGQNDDDNHTGNKGKSFIIKMIFYLSHEKLINIL